MVFEGLEILVGGPDGTIVVVDIASIVGIDIVVEIDFPFGRDADPGTSWSSVFAVKAMLKLLLIKPSIKVTSRFLLPFFMEVKSILYPTLVTEPSWNVQS